MSPRFPARQRGAIGLVAALTLGMGLLFVLMVVDSSRLFLEQRKLQRIADMAALEAAGQLAVCSGTGPQAAALARASAVRNGFELSAVQALDTTCGSLQTGANSLRSYSVDATRHEAIRVVASTRVATSVAAGVLALARGNPVPDFTLLSASAVAATPRPPQAMLRIRSTAATLDSRQAPLLNALVDPLGGHVQLDLLGWQGLANTQINLLAYLDQLAIDAGVSAGNYQQLLSAGATATQLLQAAVKVLQRSGATAEVVTNLGRIAVGSDNSRLLQLGSMLDLQSGTTQAGLDAGLRVLDLVQSVILLSTKENAATVEMPINLLGLANGKVRLKVIEPQQLSAIGNPQTDTIRVQTAQVRALVSLELPVLSTVAGLVNAVLDLASPLTNILNNLLSLNVMGTLQSLTCALGIPCKVTDIRLLPGTVSVDVGINVARASSEVSDYSCNPEKTLTAPTRSAAVDIAIGQFKNPEDFFSNGTGEVTPLPLIDIGTNVCSRVLFLPPICGTRVAFAGGGIGVKVNAPLLGSNSTDPASDLRFAPPGHTPPDIDRPPAYLSTSASNIIDSLNDTIAGIEVQAYKPVSGNLLGAVVTQVAGLLDGVANILEPLIKGLLGPLVDPLVNALLKTLGIDLLKVEVGANLTCSSSRAQLVQ
ncbi:pilus assembly protein TadG-related protein [Pseudomonas sp. BJa5]|uniref:pilus assembly protein TadG-related protein n=1 Tax=Pseudomonas sp. BJa5 TaxID=2936270 RepID=UPI00255960C1|nr:pilus assembly protein TadG-related protein [Pseudomonas sp. BGr12]MDL2422307.1 pilus assembly protein TadG-related protein [Pseudomonas sp. BGr12]